MKSVWKYQKSHIFSDYAIDRANDEHFVNYLKEYVDVSRPDRSSMQMRVQKIFKYPIIGGNDDCKICQSICNFIDDAMQKGTSPRKILSYFLQQCSKIRNPDDRSSCMDFFNQYTQEICNMLESGSSAEEICVELQVCQ
jgi:hypothetical protein